MKCFITFTFISYICSGLGIKLNYTRQNLSLAMRSHLLKECKPSFNCFIASFPRWESMKQSVATTQTIIASVSDYQDFINNNNWENMQPTQCRYPVFTIQWNILYSKTFYSYIWRFLMSSGIQKLHYYFY